MTYGISGLNNIINNLTSKTMNTDYKTMIMFLPTPNKKITYGELRNSVRSLLGSVYENEDTKNAIEKADSLIPINFMEYDRQLSEEEKKAVDSICTSNGIVVLFIEGTESAFDNVENNTITIVLEEIKED